MTDRAQALRHRERVARNALIGQAQNAFTQAAATLATDTSPQAIASAIVLASIGLIHLSKADLDERARGIAERYVQAIIADRNGGEGAP